MGLLLGMMCALLSLSAHATTVSTPAQMMASSLANAIEKHLGQGHASSSLTPQALDRWLPPPEA